MNPNQKIEAGKLKIKSEIAKYQSENKVPNFIVELILSELLIEVKNLRMSEMYIETLKGDKQDGNTDQRG